MARQDPRIVFAASLTRIVQDDQLTVNFNGGDQGELRARLKQAVEVLNQHTKIHNDKVLDLTAEIDQKARQVKADIERAYRQQLADAGLLPRTFIATDPLETPKEANGGAGPAGATHLRSDP